MASKKTFAAIDFQGAATIKIGGTAGNSQYLKTASNGLLQWANATSAVDKKEFTIEWGSDYSSNSEIDNVTSAGAWDADYVTIRLTHGFGTEHIVVSVLDKDDAMGKGANAHLDLNVGSDPDDALVTVVDTNRCDIKFNYVNNDQETNDTFKITVIG